MKDLNTIFNYWKDKAIHKSGRVILEKEAEEVKFVDTIPVVQDWGEPMCWACNKPIIGDYELQCEASPYGNDDIPKIWNDKKVKSRLNRCHILAKQLGGPDNVDNLFLMCEPCHRISPDTRNRDAFMRWIYVQRQTHTFGMNFNEIIKKITEEFKSRGYSLKDIAVMFALVNISEEEICKYMKKNIGKHGFSIAQSSMIIGCVDLLENLIKSRLGESYMQKRSDT